MLYRTNTYRAAQAAVEHTRPGTAQASVEHTRTGAAQTDTDRCRTDLVFCLFWFNLFSLLQNASEHIFENVLLFLFSEMKFRAFFYLARRNGIPRVFCSAEQPEFRRN